MVIDHWVAALLAPLACWVILNGVDDLVIDAAALLAWLVRKFYPASADHLPTDAELGALAERRIAVFVPLWREHRVIRRMIENNARRLNYSNFDFFVGVYPNDAPTIAAVEDAMKPHGNVHLAFCPHDGPTSKADCLNWIYQRMLLYEEEHGARFDMVVIHDAEDIMEPDALRWLNYYARTNDMVQIPVLALKTPLHEMTHGIYCDEFAEFQMKDMQARHFLGGFIPCSGVGAGFSRKALEKLAEKNSNRVFEPRSLTEDYEIGLRIHALGFRQKFVPVQIRHGRPVATREYFPRRFGLAVRQRCRWVIGIALQSWEFHGARESVRYLYWFWRDRKGLVSNVVAPLANILFLYGLATLTFAGMTHQPWGLARQSAFAVRLSAAGFAFQILNTSIRMGCSARIYGWGFAAAAPARAFLANWLNCLATVRALSVYTRSRISGKALVWAKTDHLYPSRSALAGRRQPIGEVLVALGHIRREDLESARSALSAGEDLGARLLALGLISDRALRESMARSHGVAFGKPPAHEISEKAVRILPARLAREMQVLAFRVTPGELHLVTPMTDCERAEQEIRRFTCLDCRFQIVTAREFREMISMYLPDVT